ncbi:MAG TPA: FAD-dependent oxidoreductase [Candidatus Hydrogenedentes bacterium]|nr:FAD-dependent oxidoreductase [Candidatus Hydrogenedentota bacterium]HQE82256.1 FAD-dependent oxidoreductase [Candidatus Hydrogenedentota bacterium]HQH52455.1 FAD-dependent oxidoreductase [Candidatus Hydrogenedentota bacterium]HQM48012.1 FAD-dependent oxidoreductase [Candidatus Hydrogenedentota bacterium]
MKRSRRDFFKTTGMCAAAIAAPAVAAHEKPPTPGTPAPEVRWSRKVPVRYEADVAVVGGGIAGVCAALAAAKSGARVILVERFAVCGGNATVGGVGAFCGETAGQGEAFDTIIAGLETWKAIAPYEPYEQRGARVFNHEILAIVLQEILLSRNVKLLLHTGFVDALEQGGRVSECIVCGPSGPEALRARQFIDCSGEAMLVRMAGFEVMKGRPEDGYQLPMSLMYFVRHVAEEDAQPQLPDGWFDPVRTKEDLPMTSIWPNGPRANALKLKVPMFDASDTESLTAAEIRARRRMMEVLDYFQRIEKKPWLLDHCSPRIGIREGCRIVGDYVLKLEDLRAGRTFDDAIARGVFYLDGHKPDDEKRTYIIPEDQRRVPPYQIPFRSLLTRGAKNILAAGRCFSADQLALSSARVMTTCAMMGQAAGVAAAMAAEAGCDPRELDYGNIRTTVTGRGAKLDV